MIKNILVPVFCMLIQTATSQISSNVNPTISQIQSLLQGNGNVITGLTITCPSGAYATFNNGAPALGGSLNSGILLTTGSATNIAGPPSGFASTDNSSSGGGGSALGNALSGGTTFDGCYINFMITPSCSTLSLNYVFASEEYPEYSSGTINDVFGFVISGLNPAGGTYNQANIATLPGTTTPVSIQNVNNGNANAGPCVNCAYYIADPPGLVYDGATTVLTASTSVVPCQQYTMTIGVWDDSDGIFDSGVFLDINGVACSGYTNSINAAVSSSTLCSSQSVTLTANGGLANASYSWTSSSNGNLMSTSGQTVTANPIASSSYTLSYNDSTTCVGVGLQEIVDITFLSAPNFSVSSSASGTLCTGQSATLTANAGVGNYTWTPNSFLNVDNAQSVVSTPTTSTSYTVNYEDMNGCTNSAGINVSVSVCTGINSLTGNKNGIEIYPNPVSSKLYFASDFNFINIKVYDQNGRLLIVPVNTDYINCSLLNSGVYTIEFKTDRSTFYKKFVKMD